MLKLYIANKNYSSWSLRPWILLRMLEIPFEEVLVPFQGDATREAFLKFSPTARVPCLVDGELTVWDSLAITEYVAEQYSAVWPADRAARAWARSAVAEIHSGFNMIRDLCSMSCGIRVRLRKRPPGLVAEWQRMAELWAEGLDRFGGPYLAGAAFTAVDAFYAPVAFRVMSYSPVLPARAQGYADMLLALAPMRAWYEAGIAETWRDEAHDLEVERSGDMLEDLRAT